MINIGSLDDTLGGTLDDVNLDFDVEATDLGDGSASSPSLAFLADDDVGLYRPASDSLGFAANGIQKAEWNTSGLEIVNDGSGANPVLNSNNANGKFLQVNDGVQLPDISAPNHAEGQLFYDTDLRTLSFHNDQSAVTVNIGEENQIRVINKSGSQIDNGEVVYIDGFNANSAVPTIQLAKADDAATAQADGMATQNIPNDSEGYITTTGAVRGLDTSSFTNGDRLFLSDSTAGAVTTTEPSAPNFSINVGRVARSSNGNGIILVNFGETRGALFSTGSVPFANSNGRLIEDSSNLSWDNSNDVLTSANVDLINPSGTNPRLSSNSSNKRLLVEDELEINNVGDGANPIFSCNSETQSLDFAGNYRPDIDASRVLGLSNRRWSRIHSQSFQVEASSGDANPVVQADSDGVKFGPGGGTGLDVLLKRDGSSFLALRNAVDGANRGLKLDILQFNDRLQPPSGNTPEIQARDADDDSLVTVATLNRASTPTFDLNQARVPSGASAFDVVGPMIRNVNPLTGDGSATTISAGDYFVPIDTSSNSETVNLPSSPSDGEEHIIKRNGSSSVTIDGNGNNIDGSASISLGSDDARARVIFSSSTGQWERVD